MTKAMDNITTFLTETVSTKVYLGISWVGSFLVIQVSWIPLALSCIASLFAIYKHWLDIRKSNKKD